MDPSSLFTHGAKAAQYECSAAAAVAGWHALPLRGSLQRRNATTGSGIWDLGPLGALCQRAQRTSGLSSRGGVPSASTLKRAGLGVSASECLATAHERPRARGHCSRGRDRTGGGSTCAVAQSRLHVVAGAVSVSRYPVRVLGAWDLDVLIVLHLVAQLDLETLPRQGAAAGELSVSACT